MSVSAPTLMAQTSATPPRIHQAVNELALVALKGNVPALARAEFDQGRASASTPLTYMRLVLSRTPEQQAALDKYAAELQDKSSPNYHKWLTPEQFGKLYGPADSDIAALVAWLQSHGLKVESIPPGRTNVPFSGTVQQVEEALHTSIHSYLANGEQFYSNDANPSIPAALSAVVSGVANLNTIKPRHNHLNGKVGMFDPGAGRLTPAVAARATGPGADLTGGGGTPNNPYFLYIVPADAAVIYDTPNVALNPSFTGTKSYSGLGVTIGIGGDAAILPATVANFRTLFLGNSIQPTITNVDGVTANGDTDEAYIDTELAGGLAPGATIHFYTATNLGTAINQMLTDNAVDIFSLSFGFCEKLLSGSENAALNADWEQAELQGIAVTVSTGDSGSAGCDDPGTVTTASLGLQVSGWGSTAHNIAVGGTDTDALTSSTFTNYVSPPGTPGAGSWYGTAKSYIPESAWNDSTQNNTTISANIPWAAASGPNIVAGSGGASSCSSQSALGACTGGYAKPAWQRGTGVLTDGVRDVPDISLLSGNGYDYSAWTVCTDDPISAGSAILSNCSPQPDGSFYINAFGGTSTAAPAFAGILAMVQQKTGGRLGQAAKELYDLYNGSNAGAVFHDITVGNNSVPCTSGTPDCTKNGAGNDFLTGYDTTTGYDLATGIGSVDAAQLVKYWGTAVGTESATLTVVPSLTTMLATQSLVVTGTVSGSAGTATGTATLSGGGYTSSAATLDSGGGYSITIPANRLAVGTDTLTVAYSGDPTYSSTTNFTSVQVNAGAAATVTLTPPTQTVTTNQIVNVTATITGASGTPTGTVTLSSGGYTSTAQTLSNGVRMFAIPAGSLAKGTDSLTATYSGDSVYGSATGTSSVTVNGIAASVSVNPSVSTLNVGAALTVSGTVSGAGATPTGTVTLTGGGFTSSAQTLSNGNYSITIPANSLAIGSDTLTVAYSGDATYNSTTNSTSVQVNAGAAATVTLTPATQTVTTNQAVNVTATIAGASGTPTGTVTLAGGGYSSTAQTLSGGSYTFTIPAGSLAKGTDTLTVTYGGDQKYGTTTGTAQVLVNLLTPTVTVSLAGTANTGQALSVPVTVSGAGGTPTGTVTLSGGGYTSAAQTLTAGATTFTIPQNGISVGADLLTAAYSGDSVYSTASGAATVTVTASVYTLAATAPAAVTAGASASSTITVSTTTGYAGAVTLTCSLTASPSGATRAPVCTVPSGSSSVTLSSTTASGSGTVNFTTTAPVTASLERRGLGGWAGAGGGAVLAFLVLVGIPRRRRNWLTLLSLLVVMMALGGMAACGGGGGSSGGGTTTTTPGTTAGTYTFTVTGTGTPAVSPAPTATVTLVVN
ncbi:MAG TPA: Ig-like domain repeat protein [Terracidiphilus sp.]